MPNTLMAHVAPLGWQRVNLNGDHLWGVDGSLGPDGFWPLHGIRYASTEAA